MKEAFLGKSAKFKTIPVLRRIRWYLSFVIPMCEAAGISGHIHIHIHTYIYTHIHTRRITTVTLARGLITAAFLTKVQCGPDYVCMSFHSMMYRQTVVDFDKSKYNEKH